MTPRFGVGTLERHNILVADDYLDYCCSVWAPYKKGDIEALEKVQKRATKILPSLRHISYPDRLKVL